MEAILEHIPAAPYQEGTLQMQVTSLDYSSFVGRIAIGRVARGVIRENQPVSLVKRDGKIVKLRVKELHTFEGIGRVKIGRATCMDSVCQYVWIQGGAVSCNKTKTTKHQTEKETIFT